MVVKQQWVGRVEELHEDYFVASLRDVTTTLPPDEEIAEIWLEQLSPSDLPLVRPGAVFYWVIGYRDEPYGQRIGSSSFHFRRRLALTEEERAVVDQRVEDLWEWLESAPSN